MQININFLHTGETWIRVFLCLGTSAAVQPPVPVSAHVDCEVGKSQVGDAVSNIINCWSVVTETVWLFQGSLLMDDGEGWKYGEDRLGCSGCSQLCKLGCEQLQRMSLSSEWRGYWFPTYLIWYLYVSMGHCHPCGMVMIISYEVLVAERPSQSLWYAEKILKNESKNHLKSLSVFHATNRLMWWHGTGPHPLIRPALY